MTQNNVLSYGSSPSPSGLWRTHRQHLTDSRQGKNTQLPLATCCASRSTAASRLWDVNDAERLSQDRMFRLIVPRRFGIVGGADLPLADL